MRGRVAVLLLLLLSTFPSFPQCTWTPRASVQFRFSAYDVAVRNDLLWIASGYGVRLMDARTLTIVDDLPLPGSTRVVEPETNGFAYAGSGSRLYVVARNGNTLSAVRFVDAGATINNILAAGSYLFVATTSGLLHFDVIDPSTPVRTSAVLPTSEANVTALAAANNRLYAADGDNTLEVFSISIPALPQRTGELATVVRATDVHTDGSGLIYVGDVFGLNTDVFAESTRIARLPVGSSSFAAGTGGVHFVAGPDRTLRMIDFSTTTVVKELFEHQLPPAGGTENVIRAIARAGERVYVAAGDIGLAVFDADLSPPFTLAAYRTSATTSTVVSDNRAWFAGPTGVIREERIVEGGISFVTERTWNGARRVHDVEGTTLLTSDGNTATLWSLDAATPVAQRTSTYAGNVKAAVIHNGEIVTLLDDGSVWSGPSQKVTLPPVAYVARSGSALVFAELRAEGATVLHYFTSLAATPVTFTTSGVTTALALDATRAAIFTFRGIEVIRLDGSGSFALPGSARVIPRQLAFSGSDILALDTRRLYVYGGDGALVREHALPADAIAFDARPSVATIATSEGTLAASYRAEQQAAPATQSASRFYTKVVAGGDRVYQFAPDTIDVFSTLDGDSPRYIAGVSAAGVIDIGATIDMLFTLNANGTVAAYSRHGAPLRQTTINEGPDAQPRAIHTAGNAVWVSLSRGCQSGACEEKTLVLDPATLSVTASMAGRVKDVVTAGTTAYALFDAPSQVRVIAIADPLHPSVTRTAPISDSASATSLALHAGRVFVIGDRLYEYDAGTLALRTTHLTAIVPETPQQVRVAGNCMIITGRTENPQQYNAVTIAALGTLELPAPVRWMAVQDGRLLLLTSHSLEVWSSGSVEGRRRRAVN